MIIGCCRLAIRNGSTLNKPNGVQKRVELIISLVRMTGIGTTVACTDKNRTNARRRSRTNINGRIPDHPRLRQVEVQITDCIFNQPRSRLAAIAIYL